jgi:glyoxylase-like metal-dependent hydrolase (beta-lactamase superfamily II)
MKSITVFFLLVCFSSWQPLQRAGTPLEKVKWICGSANCRDNTDPAIQVLRYNDNTFILRQNKCVNYEAPFMFLFLGNDKALLMDTGATEDENQFPLYATVRRLLDEWEKKIHHSIELVVAHTHAHGDHIAGDKQFKDKPRTTVLGLQVKDVSDYFKIENWPVQNGQLNLGNRIIDIIPIPGHQQASIAVYDHTTKILLSGDSFYPGRLYVRDWAAFKLSTQRLLDFATHHSISYILGNHIEMTTTAGKDYPTGTTYQPAEHILPMTMDDLRELNEALKAAGDLPKYDVHANFIIAPK